MPKPKQSEKPHVDATARMTTGEATVGALIAHGIDTVYALPGVHNDHLFDALFKAGDKLRTIHTRHEQGAAYMALGAALATGKPQVYSVVPGPGLLNSAAALLTAYSMNAPVLGLIGQISQSAIGRGLGHLHEIRDQAGIISRLVDYSARIREPTEAAGLVAEAVEYPWSSHAHYCGRRMDRLITAHPTIWSLGNTPFAREAAYTQLVTTGMSDVLQRSLTDAALNGWGLGTSRFISELQKGTARRLTRGRAGRPPLAEKLPLD